MAKCFRDDQLEAELARSGYVIRNCLPQESCARLLSAIRHIRPDLSSGPESEDGLNRLHVTELDADLEYKARVAELGLAFLQPCVDRLLDNYRILTTSLFVKPASRGELQYHSDWTVTADPGDAAINIWCPLVDVAAANGALQLIEGSHRLTTNVVGPTIMPFHWHYRDSLSRRAKTMILKAGEALLFDSRLLHGSPRNMSSEPRFAIRAMAIRRDAKPVLYRRGKRSPNELEMFEMDSEAYARHTGDELLNGNFKTKQIGTVTNSNQVLEETQFFELLDERSHPRSD